MQTKVFVGKEDDGKSIQLGVGDLLEVSLPETSGRAAWHVEVDADVLAPVSSLTNTQTVWVLDEEEHMDLRSFRAARVGRALLKMTYDAVDTGSALDSFTLEVVVGDPPKPKPIRQAMPAPQLMIVLFEIFLMAIAAGVLAFRLATLTADVLSEQPRFPEEVVFAVGQGDLLLALLGTVVMGAIAGYALVRMVAFFASRLR